MDNLLIIENIHFFGGGNKNEHFSNRIRHPYYYVVWNINIRELGSQKVVIFMIGGWDNTTLLPHPILKFDHGQGQ